MENILFYISGFMVTKLITLISCTACRSSLISSPSTQSVDHDYCGMKTTQHSDNSAVSAFTLFINGGSLTILLHQSSPLSSVLNIFLKRLSSRLRDASIQARNQAVKCSWKFVIILLSMSRVIQISLEIEDWNERSWLR